MSVSIDYKEKRGFPRATIRTMVRVTEPQPIRHFISQNLSGGGMFVLSDDPIEVETKLKLEITLPSIKAPVRTSGEVVWKQRQHPSGFAIKFTNISETAQHIIRWEINRFLAQNEKNR